MMEFPDVLETLQECAAMCERMCTLLLDYPDVQARGKQIKLLSDCAAICTLAAKYVARESTFTKYICDLCAYVCEVCGNECIKHHDKESQMCGKMCHSCANECKKLAKSA